MNLTNRRPRPLTRDNVTFRDDRLFIVACDDTYAPKQYFGFFRFNRLKVHVVPATDGMSAASHVLERLIQYDYEADDERWMLLDSDHYTQGSHLASFTRALQEAQQKNISVAISKPCFEIWLLLHHAEISEVTGLTDATNVCEALLQKLGEYNKANLKAEHYHRQNVTNALKRASLLDQTVSGGIIPNSNTTRVYLLWRAILRSLAPDLRRQFLGSDHDL